VSPCLCYQRRQHHTSDPAILIHAQQQLAPSPPACISNPCPRSGRPPAERPPLLSPPAIAVTPSNCAARRPRAGRRRPPKSPVLFMHGCFGPLADLYSSPSYMAVLGPRCDEILRNPCPHFSPFAYFTA